MVIRVTNPTLEPVYEDLRGKLRVLDMLVSMGETPDEIDSYVYEAADMASALFTGWLLERNIDDGVEILAQLAQHIFSHVYLNEEAVRRRQRLLSKVSKSRLASLIDYIEFGVTQEEWKGHLNPFDGAILFFEFLGDTGYEIDVAQKKRAVEALRRSLKKYPCSEPQPGMQLMQ